MKRWPKLRVPLLRRLLREPMVHFLVAGLALFAGYAALQQGRGGSAAAAGRIELTQDDLRQMSITWLAQGRPAPTAEELDSLVEARVREEVLYREALALGLDKGDTIVKRRLAQKMEFLFEDVAALREPATGELETWFAKHAERFALPARATFRALYFSPDKRGVRARDDAARVHQLLTGEPAESSVAAGLADPFMFQDYYADRSFDELAKTFGPSFAQALFQQSPGSWQGPIESGYGWHLVWIDEIAPRRVPAFEDVEQDVRSVWIEDQRAKLREGAYQAMRARYEVVLPKSVIPETTKVASAPTGEGTE